MNNLLTSIRAAHNLSVDGYELAFIQRDRQLKKVYVGEIVFKEIPEGSYIAPALSVGKGDMQLLMDDIWNLGIRPTNSQDSKSIVDAKDSHIKDLRKIAFKGLGVKL